jgi:hypothetical protein
VMPSDATIVLPSQHTYTIENNGEMLPPPG